MQAKKCIVASLDVKLKKPLQVQGQNDDCVFLIHLRQFQAAAKSGKGLFSVSFFGTEQW